MADKNGAEVFPSQEPSLFSQERSELLSAEPINFDQLFCYLEGITLPECFDNSLFENAELQENHPNTQVVPKAPPNDAVYVPSSLPASQNWTGVYDFNVSFEPQENKGRGVSWTYSRIKDKLYVRKDALCPINFSAKNIMSFNVDLRVMALYSSPEHASEVVHRCVNHSMSESSKGVFQAEHLVRCENQMAFYEIDPTTKRHSVIVPFERPPDGQQFTTYIYRFACYGSCVGGPNRRPLMLIFSLEERGKVVGRQKLDVKICACPRRDKTTEEQHSGYEVTHERPVRQREKRMVSLSDALDFTKSVYLPPLKKKKSNNAPFTLSVSDQGCYKFLKCMKNFFDMCCTVNSLPPNVKALIDIDCQKQDNQESD